MGKVTRNDVCWTLPLYESWVSQWSQVLGTFPISNSKPRSCSWVRLGPFLLLCTVEAPSSQYLLSLPHLNWRWYHVGYLRAWVSPYCLHLPLLHPSGLLPDLILLLSQAVSEYIAQWLHLVISRWSPPIGHSWPEFILLLMNLSVCLRSDTQWFLSFHSVLATGDAQCSDMSWRHVVYSLVHTLVSVR